MRAVVNVDWTEEHLTLANKLWQEGESASRIGVVLGRSRNSVLGKLFRTNARKRAVVSGANAKLHCKATRVPKPKGPPTIKVTAPLPPEEPPAGPLVSLEALTDHTCRWPIGDPLLAGFGFCGQATAMAPYCDRHTHQSRNHTIMTKAKRLEAAETGKPLAHHF